MIRHILRAYIMPSYDPTGNVIRATIITLTFIILWLTAILMNPSTRLDQISTLESILFAFIPMWGAGYAIWRLWDKREAESVNQPARLSWKAFLSSNMYFWAVFLLALGMAGWGLGNIYWVVLQSLVTRNLFESPPIWLGYDFLYEMLQVGFLLGMGCLYRAQSLSLRAAFWANRWTTTLLVVANTAVAIFFLLTARGWSLSNSEDPLLFGLQITYAVIDGFILATIFLYPRTLDVTKWSSPLRLGLRIMTVGWLIFVFADQVFELGESFPIGSPYRYFDGSLYDFFFIAGIVVLVHGLIFAVYAILEGHPHILFLSETQRALIFHLLDRDTTIDDISHELHRERSTIERQITALYKATGFAGKDRTNKREDLVAHYRPQVEAYFSEQMDVGRHPHFTHLTEEQRRLTRLLVNDLRNKTIAHESHFSETTVERRITDLYLATGFTGKDRTRKREDFVAYYRPQVATHDRGQDAVLETNS